jgi:hypothetical protein
MYSQKVSRITHTAIENPYHSRSIEAVEQLSTELIMKEPWSHVLVKEGTDWLAGYNFASTELLVYDFDKGKPTVAEMTQQLAGYKHIIGTSMHHQLVKGDKPACDRYRVVLFLDKPITDIEVYKATLQAHAEMLGFHRLMDTQTKDVARYWRPCREIVSEQLVGADFPAVEPKKRGKKVKAKSQLPADMSAGVLGVLSPKTVRFIAGEWEDGEWHGALIAAALDCKAQGYSEEQAIEKLSRAAADGVLDDKHDLPMIRDVYERREPYRDFVDPEFEFPVLTTAKRGGVEVLVPSPAASANFDFLISKAAKRAPLMFYRNEINGQLYVGEKEGQPISDALVNELYSDAANHGLARDKALIQAAIDRATLDYNPVKDMVESVEWDGKDRIAELFSTLQLSSLANEADIPFYRDVLFKRWLLAAVKRVYIPGAENGVLIFIGEQGTGKSRWFNKLAGAFWQNGFSDGPIDPNNKDSQAILIDSFIHHTGEFDYTTSSRHVGALKDYFNKAKVTFRRPYEKFATSKQTICNFCATVNPGKFLQDVTGNRRFYVIPVERANSDYTIDMQQLAAQVRTLVLDGEITYLEKHEIDRLNKLNENYLYQEDFIERLRMALTPGESARTKSEILASLDIDLRFLNKTQKQEIENVFAMARLTTVNHSGVTKYKIDSSKLLMGVKESRFNMKGLVEHDSTKQIN